jgi:hypothetical protein
MSVKTVMICSKFSPTCVQALEMLKQKNISVDPFIKLLWIDHPNMRNIVRSSNLVRTVPAIVVVDEARDLSVVYEGERFREYLNTFIQNHHTPQNKPNVFSSRLGQPVNQSLFHAANNVALSQAHSQNMMAQAVQDMSAQQVQLESRTPNQIHEQREGIRSAINNHVFGPNGLVPENRTGYLDAIKAQAVQASQKQELAQEQNRARLEEERRVRTEELQRKHEESMRLLPSSGNHRAEIQDAHQARQEEHDRIQRQHLLEKLRSDPSNAGLNAGEIEQLARMEELQIKYREIERIQTHEKQLHALRTPDAPFPTAMEDQKQAIIAELRAMPPIPIKDRQVMEMKQRQKQQADQSLATQMSHEAQKPYFQALSKKYDLEREAQKLQEELNRNPQSTEIIQQLQILGHLYTQNAQQIERLKPGAVAPEPQAAPAPAIPQQLQQEQRDAQLELQKEQERKNRSEGFTSIVDLGEDSLYDHQQRRPMGTDVHQSEESTKQHLQASKRNSLNQQVRAMTNDRDVRPLKGLGHESMAKTSLTVIEQPREEVTSLDRLGHGEIDESMLSIPPSDLIDLIDDEEPEPEPPRPQIKKKSSIVDRAKELEKGRM